MTLMHKDEMLAGCVPKENVSNVDIATLSGADVKYSKYQNVVFVAFNTASSISANSWVDIGLLPEGARPANGFYGICVNYSSGALAELRIMPNGKVSVWAFSSGQYVGHATFVQ